ncbi:MAG: hypothetical protein RI565_08520 [Schleiferiaceae bacterium]|nr:hypothetical protein [Schleiferiaceae bacterium]
MGKLNEVSGLYRQTLIRLSYLAFILLIGPGQSGCTEKPQQQYLENFERFLKEELPGHAVDERAAQYVLIPTRGCRGCLEKAAQLMDSRDFPNTYFIVYVGDSPASSNDHHLRVESQRKLNRVYLGVEGKPAVLQIREGDLEAVFGITPTEGDDVQRMTSFEEKYLSGT